MRTLLPGIRSTADLASALRRRAARAVIRCRGGTFVSSPDVVFQSGPSDCGPAALATLIRALGGDPPSTASIARLAGTGARGTSFAGLSLAALHLGVRNEVGRLGAADMETLGTPVIAWVAGGHFVTVVPDSRTSALVLDPQAGPYRIGRPHLARFWKGEALVPSPRLERCAATRGAPARLDAARLIPPIPRAPRDSRG